MEINSSLSDYEKVRLKNIERNLAFLSNIGLSGSYSLISINKPERSTKSSKDPPIVPAVVEPSRRSSRIAALENVTGVDSQSTYDISSSSSKRRKGNNPFGFEKVDINLNPPHRFLSCLSAAGTQPSSSASNDPQSTRNISVNYSQFISPMTLGKPHHTFGKASVVTHSNHGVTPKFSKYSGILEWTNCVFLWVNLGGQSADGGYDNTFLDGGRSFVWFGGSKMTKESPITQRLLQAGISQIASLSSNPLSTEVDREQHPINVSNTIPVDDAAPTTGQVENISDTNYDVVLLFVRIVGEPYTCLGSLSVLNCNFDMHPLVIHWRLNEYDQMMNGIGSGEFQRILKASPMS